MAESASRLTVSSGKEPRRMRREAPISTPWRGARPRSTRQQARPRPTLIARPVQGLKDGSDPSSEARPAFSPGPPAPHGPPHRSQTGASRRSSPGIEGGRRLQRPEKEGSCPPNGTPRRSLRGGSVRGAGPAARCCHGGATHSRLASSRFLQPEQPLAFRCALTLSL